MWPVLLLVVPVLSSSVDYYAEEFGSQQQDETKASSSSNNIPFFAIACTVWLMVAGGSLVGFPHLIQLGQRRQDLKRWAQLVRDGRDKKVHQVLSIKANETETEEDCWKTAAETREQILAAGKNSSTCASDNIALLARRCRTYGRHESINAITEELYDQAHQSALKLNTIITTETAPPLYGVPVCVKEWLSVKGTYATAGMACRLTKPSEQDCLLVQLMKQAGAIPLVKGNIMQLLMLAETNNRIWGRTSNPWDLQRTPGGSSGGDAALVAMGCVPLSVSSDGAGSIRIPASYCGIVGFKPTTGRSSLRGCLKPRKDDIHGLSLVIPTTIGPMARCVDDCALFMKAVCVPALFEQDPTRAPPVPWNDAIYKDNQRKLNIGYFHTDGWFRPCATSERAMTETIANLEKAGHTCLAFTPPTNGWAHFELLVQLNSSEGINRMVEEALEGEAAMGEYQAMLWGDYIVSKLPLQKWTIPLIGWGIQMILGARMAHLFRASRALSTVYQVWQATAELIELRGKWSDAVRDAGVDVILHPAMPLPAPFHGKASENPSVSYCILAPLLGWPSGVVPVTTVQEDEQYYHDKSLLPTDQQDAFAEAASRVMNNSAGLPMNVSVLAPAFRDVTCLLAMKEIERLANFKARPQGYKEAVR